MNRLEVTPDKKYLAAAGNPHIRLYDVNSNHPQPVSSFGFRCVRLIYVCEAGLGNYVYVAIVRVEQVLFMR